MIIFSKERLAEALDNKAKRMQVFTKFEASIDLIQLGHPAGVIKQIPSELAIRWTWPFEDVIKFLDSCISKNILSPSLEILNADYHYSEEYNPGLAKKKEECQKVIDIFNEVFNRNTILTDYRLQIIWARFQEGKKYKPVTTLESFRAVFQFKKKEWFDDEQTKKYLEIETLCAKKHFFKYLEQAREDFLKKQPKKP